MKVRPITPTALVEELAERIAACPAKSWRRVAVDASPGAHPGRAGLDVTRLRAVRAEATQESFADVVVKVDDPHHPALVEPA